MGSPAAPDSKTSNFEEEKGEEDVPVFHDGASGNSPSPPAASSSPQNLRASRLETLLEEKKGLLNLDVVDEDDLEAGEEKIDGVEEEEDEEASQQEDFEGPRRRQSLKELGQRMSLLQAESSYRQVGVRMKDFSYHVPVKMDAPTVPTVLNQSICYLSYEVFRRVSRYCNRKTRSGDGWAPSNVSDIVLPFAKKAILRDLNLVFNPGQTYLVLGPPGCGVSRAQRSVRVYQNFYYTDHCFFHPSTN